MIKKITVELFRFGTRNLLPLLAGPAAEVALSRGSTITMRPVPRMARKSASRRQRVKWLVTINASCGSAASMSGITRMNSA